ncbi:hypothetical protein V6N12_051281 [Hibiscus sabdariffa]|uniref:Uncharacterized protein n=1 Tax=Hibiscus sabdariffa TaxID=183260 RepID=A0ABR2GEW0_9ROSI
MDNTKVISTLMSFSNKLPPLELSMTLDISKNRQLLGLLQYLTITHFVYFFCRESSGKYMHGHSLAHWTSVKPILHYLKETLCHGILFRSTSFLHLTAFIDADWGGSSTNDISTTG